MNKLIRKILIIIPITVFSHSVWAQVYACQFVKSAGLNFQNNQWITSTFKPNPPFFLKIVDGRISEDTAAKIMGDAGANINCTSKYSFVNKSIIYTCSDYSAQLIFSSETLAGAISHIFGAVSSTQERDALTVSGFNCQKM